MIRKALVLTTAMAAACLPTLASADHDGYQYAKVVDVDLGDLDAGRRVD